MDTEIHLCPPIFQHIALCYLASWKMRINKTLYSMEKNSFKTHLLDNYRWSNTAEGDDYWRTLCYTGEMPKKGAPYIERIHPLRMKRELHYSLNCVQSVMIRNLFAD